MVRLAVIGVGSHSTSNHGAALRACRAAHPDQVELAAVCDLDLKKAQVYAEKFGFLRTYDNYDRMLASERLDGLIAITPLPLTEQIAGDLLTKGLPLVIEKPPGETSGATRRLLQIAERHSALHMISFNRRFSPVITKAREWLAGPGKGRPPKLTIGRMLRRARREDGFVVGTGIHLIDAILSFMDRPEEVFTRKVPTEIPGRSFYNASVRFRDGGLADVILSSDVGVNEETFEIHGQEYCIQIDTAGCRIRVFDRGQEALSWQAPEGSEESFKCGAVDETAAFIRYIKEGKGYWPTLRDGLVSMITSEAVEAGGEVRLDVG
jgi:predicted dehydrogenase